MELLIRAAITTRPLNRTSPMKLMQDPLHSVSLSTMLETFTNHFMLLQKLTLPIQVVIEVEIQKLFHQKVVQATFTLFGTQLPMSGLVHQFFLSAVQTGHGIQQPSRLWGALTKSTKHFSTTKTSACGHNKVTTSQYQPSMQVLL